MSVIYKLPMGTKEENAQRSQRLRAIRERVHNMRSQREFAAVLDVPDTRYRNWENGKPIPIGEAKKIIDITPGLTGDYIFYGTESGLTLELAKQLRASINPGISPEEREARKRAKLGVPKD